MTDAESRGEPPPTDARTPLPHKHAATGSWRAVDDYFTDALVDEDSALVEARESSSGTTLPNIEVTAPQGRLLNLYASMIGARRILEFGTLAGYSTIWLARAVGPGGQVVTLEIEEANAEIARRNFEHAGVGERVSLRLGPAAESAQHLIDEGVEPFDMVFIDADKPNNPAYLAAAIRLTGPDAVIVIDNAVRGGAVVTPDSEDPQVLGVRQVIEDISQDQRLEATAVQTVGAKGWDGFVLARRRE